MNTLSKSIIILLLANCITAQVDSIRNFYLGHSLINTQVPQMVHEMAKSANYKSTYVANIGNGANLSWHWTSPYTGQGQSWKTALPSRTFDNFILTEAVPLKGQLQWSRTYEYLDSFYQFALVKSPDIKMFFYETWHCNDSGTPQGCEWDGDGNIPWRDRLDKDTILWQGIVNQFKIKHPGQEIVIIPGGQALAKIHDVISAGQLPGYTSHKQLFTDNIHMTAIGNYYIACVMYATIYQKSPLGLPHLLKNMYGQEYSPAPTEQQAMVLQTVAWDAVCNYKKYSGVNCTFSETNQEPKVQNILISSIANEYLSVSVMQNTHFGVYNLQGIQLKAGFLNTTDETIDISQLDRGLYILKLGRRSWKFVKM